MLHLEQRYEAMIDELIRAFKFGLKQTIKTSYNRQVRILTFHDTMHL